MIEEAFCRPLVGDRTLRAKVAASEPAIDFSSWVERHKAQVSTLKAQLSTLNSQVSTLKSQLSSLSVER
jgi:chaperonin cofactor prefoldin